MLAVKTFALGAVGVAAAAGGAAPASAQYYPGTPYGYGQAGPAQIIGQVIAQVLNPYGQWGYGHRAVNPQVAANRCTSAVQRRLQASAGYGYGYQQHNPYNPYGYGNSYNQARVLGITRVEQRSASTMRVRGVATSGMGQAQYGQYGGQPYGGYGGYGGQPYGAQHYGGGYGGYGGYAQAQADLSFRCDVDYRGRIRNIDIDRRY